MFACTCTARFLTISVFFIFSFYPMYCELVRCWYQGFILVIFWFVNNNYSWRLVDVLLSQHLFRKLVLMLSDKLSAIFIIKYTMYDCSNIFTLQSLGHIPKIFSNLIEWFISGCDSPDPEIVPPSTSKRNTLPFNID